jgi:hypothetical protein
MPSKPHTKVQEREMKVTQNAEGQWAVTDNSGQVVATLATMEAAGDGLIGTKCSRAISGAQQQSASMPSM